MRHVYCHNSDHVDSLHMTVDTKALNPAAICTVKTCGLAITSCELNEKAHDNFACIWLHFIVRFAFTYRCKQWSVMFCIVKTYSLYPLKLGHPPLFSPQVFQEQVLEKVRFPPKPTSKQLRSMKRSVGFHMTTSTHCTPISAISPLNLRKIIWPLQSRDIRIHHMQAETWKLLLRCLKTILPRMSFPKTNVMEIVNPVCCTVTGKPNGTGSSTASIFLSFPRCTVHGSLWNRKKKPHI